MITAMPAKPSGDSTADISRSLNGPVAYGEIVTTCTELGTVAVTFDDGPFIYTEHLLDVLDEFNIKATFFITGNNLDKGQIDDPSTPWPDILRRMHSAGHQLASHTWTHQELSSATADVREQQVIYNEMAFRNVLGFFPKYFRPPYATCGSACLDYLTEMGYHVINFNIDTKDYENDSEGQIQTSKDIFYDAASYDARSHAYIELTHDPHYQRVYTVTSFIIRTLQDGGYRAVTVGECLGDDPGNWYVDAS